jgi:4-hydroxythreonine-4-phosphate dehydrogenase
MNKRENIFFTCGDVNGVGPEISLKLFYYLLNKKVKNNLIFFCPVNVFRYYYDYLPLKFKFKFIKEVEDSEPDLLNVFTLQKVKMSIGRPTSYSGESAFESLEIATGEMKKNKSSIIVTAPVSKFAINLAGIEFTGQTEFFSNAFGADNYLMMFLSRRMKAALHTTHIPLKQVSKEITASSLIKKLHLLRLTLRKDFGISNPSIAVLGLNPHAGEGGNIGNEEIKIIEKAIAGFEYLKGPFVSDAFFANQSYKFFDAVYGMYHDQILIPFKMLNFNVGVNYTAGLPIVRTSPDHGTAFDIAGRNRADFTSILSAYKFAIRIHNSRLKLER